MMTRYVEAICESCGHEREIPERDIATVCPECGDDVLLPVEGGHSECVYEWGEA